MKFPILNCDLGEDSGNDEAIMPFIGAVNIACGYHAGGVETMQRTVELAVKHGVAIGAHPSFYDRTNFGRTEMNIPVPDIYDIVTQQLFILNEIAGAAGAVLQHVKPHGALYNMSARDVALANTIARAVKDFDGSLALVGLSGSCALSEARAVGLRTYSEVFADRRYQDDGNLVPRSQPGAMIRSVADAVQQVLQMTKEGTVTTLSGIKIPVLAETICMHGDEAGVVEMLKGVREGLR